MVGRARLSYDELSTSLIEVEAILNSRPLTYISSNDLDEPLTPSHLMIYSVSRTIYVTAKKRNIYLIHREYSVRKYGTLTRYLISFGNVGARSTY